MAKKVTPESLMRDILRLRAANPYDLHGQPSGEEAATGPVGICPRCGLSCPRCGRKGDGCYCDLSHSPSYSLPEVPLTPSPVSYQGPFGKTLFTQVCGPCLREIRNFRNPKYTLT